MSIRNRGLAPGEWSRYDLMTLEFLGPLFPLMNQSGDLRFHCELPQTTQGRPHFIEKAR
jgi:hypothetical protein